MPWTGTDEALGGFLCPTAGGDDIQLPAPVGVPYGNRVVEIGGGGTEELVLPDARLLELGGPHFVILAYKEVGSAQPTTANIYASGTATIPSNLLATVQRTNPSPPATSSGAVGRCYLVDNSTQAGVWVIVVSDAESTEAPTVLHPTLDRRIRTDVEEFSFELGVSGQLNVNIRTLCDEAGYDGANPAHVNVIVGPQLSATHAVIGSSSRANPALETGTFPSGSLINLTVLDNSFVTGRGGRGATGTSVTGGTVGNASTITTSAGSNAEDGGMGLKIDTPTVLRNFGRIQGGGGGGQAGAAVSTGERSGAGGGGGAGYRASLGGPAGQNSIANRGSRGEPGTLNSPGQGGDVGQEQEGLAGGEPGQPGQSSGAGGTGAAGAAGPAISVKSGVSFVKIVEGNIDGSEVSHV